MKRLQWLAIAAGAAALAACSNDDEVNMTNVEIDAADENLALPPADLNADMNVAMNTDLNADTNAVDNTATNNTSDNTTNAY